jgi:hypothetical protein
VIFENRPDNSLRSTRGLPRIILIHSANRRVGGVSGEFDRKPTILLNIRRHVGVIFASAIRFQQHYNCSFFFHLANSIMTVTKTSVLVLFTALFALSSAFSPSLLTERARLSQRTKTAINYYSNESALDSADAAEPLPLTVDDLRMLTELQTRTLTMPIVLLDSILPGQEISFTRYVSEKRDAI